MLKSIEFDVVIKADGTVVHDVTNRSEGADCRVVSRIAERMGKVTDEEQTGPFCDVQTERN